MSEGEIYIFKHNSLLKTIGHKYMRILERALTGLLVFLSPSLRTDFIATNSGGLI